MKCHSPGCAGEHQAQRVTQQVIYRQRTFVIHQVPADVCPQCGASVLAEETRIVLDGLLRRKVQAKGAAFSYEG